MKLRANLFLSLTVGAICVYLAWPPPAQHAEIRRSLLELRWRWLGLYLVTLAGVHFFRAWRWDYLLRPLSARIPLSRLLPISSVGFFAILALPARLGEFVRPYLIAERGKLRMSAALGTVAVERIVDGLLVSLFVFVSFLALRGERAPAWMMPTAWASLGLFGAAALFLVAGILWPQAAARLAVRCLLLPRLAPRAAVRLERTLVGICSGFRVLADGKNLGLFLLLSCLYWTLNGVGMYLLAFGFGLPLPLIAAFATMGLVAIGIMLPNAPGLVGQFHYFSLLGLSLYLPRAVVMGKGVAYTAVLHGVQLLWYALFGCLSLLSSHTSFARLVRASQAAASVTGAEKPARESVA